MEYVPLAGDDWPVFPEYADKLDDPRKEQITIRDMLQMRSGYRNEQLDQGYLNALFFSDNWHWLPHLVDFPLSSDPGSEFQYSEITYHLLGAIVARACETNLRSLAEAHLLPQIEAGVGDWSADADGYNFGNFEIYITTRRPGRAGNTKGRSSMWWADSSTPCQASDFLHVRNHDQCQLINLILNPIMYLECPLRP